MVMGRGPGPVPSLALPARSAAASRSPSHLDFIRGYLALFLLLNYARVCIVLSNRRTIQPSTHTEIGPHFDSTPASPTTRARRPPFFSPRLLTSTPLTFPLQQPLAPL